MKIKEVLAEAGFWKGVRQALAPQSVANRDAQRPFRAHMGLGSAFEYDGDLYRLNTKSNTWEIQDPVNKEFVPASQSIQDKFNNIATGVATPTATKPVPTPTQTNLDTNKIQPVPKLGAPTSAEQAKLQQKIDAALKAQGRQ